MIMYRYKFIKRNLITLVLSLLAVLFLFFNLKKSQKIIREIEKNSTTIFLENILDRENLIDFNEGIFFVDTTRMKHPDKVRNLTIRQCCAIESAAMANKNNKIFIIFVAPFTLQSIHFTKEMKVLLEYPNVFPLALNLVQFSIDTPLELFIANGAIFKSIFIKSHTSDVVRLLLLWKYGGTYIDTDMIVRIELNQLPHNYICRDHGFLNGAILNLNKIKGREFAEIFMKDMVEYFNGTDWGSNGPIMLQRVLSKVCGTNDVNLMSECEGFHVLPDRFCYPIKGVRWMDLFDEKISKKILKKVEFSVVVHFWNKLSQKEILKCDSKAVRKIYKFESFKVLIKIIILGLHAIST